MRTDACQSTRIDLSAQTHGRIQPDAIDSFFPGAYIYYIVGIYILLFWFA